MFTEGFEGLEETEKGPRRAYVSNVSQDDADRLSRENDRLKKALEKEKFFNKLLDQEIQELKSNNGAQEPVHSSYWYGNRGVSKGAFFSLLFVSLAMAGYIGYGVYHEKEFNYLSETVSPASPVNDESSAQFSTPSNTSDEQASVNAQTKVDEDRSPAAVSNDPVVPITPEKSAVKDSVPNIIASSKAAEEKAKAKTAVPAPARQAAEIDVDATEADVSPGPIDTRPVIARYQISSKANFYTAPDENTMRSTFISQGNDKIVGALEDKNGFIFVVYTNDLGYTSRGWLSKKDLTQVD